jgi:hypothetical protein
MSNMTEEAIIKLAFNISELDIDYWDTDSDEYALARQLLNDGVNRWEGFENTKWRELIGISSTALTTAHSYATASGFAYPGSWVRTGDQFWEVIQPERVGDYATSDSYYCYFLGNKKDGFTLNFNSNITMPSGTADYEYYKKATQTTAPTDEVEMSDPNFLAYWIASKLGEDGMDIDLFNIAENKLSQMKVANLSGYFGVPSKVNSTIDDDYGFGV